MAARKAVSIIFVTLLTLGLVACQTKKDNIAWGLFKERFLQDDGRVIDRMNQDVTHSEAVGYTLFFALSYNDRETFEKVYTWKCNNLKKNKYGLFGWKWGKAEDGGWHMLDMNNATDGDMWIAWSLLSAYKKYGEKKYMDEALGILEAIRENLIYVSPDDISYLLPAREGFICGDVLTFNPSYLLLHLFKEFARYDNKETWEKLYRDSIDLLNKSRFGRFSIHPDWADVNILTGVVNLNKEKNLFGFDAIRVPLFLSYARKRYDDPDLDISLQGYKHLVRVYNEIGSVTQPVDLAENTMSLVTAPFGFQAVFSFAANGDGNSDKIGRVSMQELEREKENYYSFCLYLFADILFN